MSPPSPADAAPGPDPVVGSPPAPEATPGPAHGPGVSPGPVTPPAPRAWRGRPRATDPGGVVRAYLRDPACGFVVRLLLLQDTAFALYPCRRAADRDRAAEELAAWLGLYRARRQGLIDSWMFFWEEGPYPRRATAVRVFRADGERLLLRLPARLRRYVRAWGRRLATPDVGQS